MTNIKSECQERILSKGELAIIMADRVERMPYFMLTGIENCIMTFCQDNPNLVEYYFSAILAQGTLEFQEKYSEWLVSYDRIRYYLQPTKPKKKKLKKIRNQ